MRSEEEEFIKRIEEEVSPVPVRVLVPVRVRGRNRRHKKSAEEICS